MRNLIVFDLDDTLYCEIDFLKSAYNSIAKNIDLKNKYLFNEMFNDFQMKIDVFDTISNKYSVDKSLIINYYRNHLPKNLPNKVDLPVFLSNLRIAGNKIGLITDGRSITQRNKLRALKIDKLFDKIIISEEFGSEKPSFANYLAFDCFESDQKFYIGDNTSKDFITPNKLGWSTICLIDQGQNIHKQNFNLETDYLPKYKIGSLTEILEIIS